MHLFSRSINNLTFIAACVDRDSFQIYTSTGDPRTPRLSSLALPRQAFFSVTRIYYSQLFAIVTVPRASAINQPHEPRSRLVYATSNELPYVRFLAIPIFHSIIIVVVDTYAPLSGLSDSVGVSLYRRQICLALIRASVMSVIAR